MDFMIASLFKRWCVDLSSGSGYLVKAVRKLRESLRRDKWHVSEAMLIISGTYGRTVHRCLIAEKKTAAEGAQVLYRCFQLRLEASRCNTPAKREKPTALMLRASLSARRAVCRHVCCCAERGLGGVCWPQLQCSPFRNMRKSLFAYVHFATLPPSSLNSSKESGI